MLASVEDRWRFGPSVEVQYVEPAEALARAPLSSDSQAV